MSSKRLFYGLLGLCGVLVIGLAGSVYLGLTMLDEQADKLKQAEIEREAIDTQELTLLRALNEIEEFSELEGVAKSIIPQEKDQARTVREIISIAQRSGANISSISFPSSDLGDDDNILSQARPVTGLPGLYELEITIQDIDGTRFNQFIAFLEGLEQNRRTSQVKSVTITPDSQIRDLIDFSINLSVFIQP
jgi:hypothetical protein